MPGAGVVTISVVWMAPLHAGGGPAGHVRARSSEGPSRALVRTMVALASVELSASVTVTQFGLTVPTIATGPPPSVKVAVELMPPVAAPSRSTIGNALVTVIVT